MIKSHDIVGIELIKNIFQEKMITFGTYSRKICIRTKKFHINTIRLQNELQAGAYNKLRKNTQKLYKEKRISVTTKFPIK